jgi:hypothetical protein
MLLKSKKTIEDKTVPVPTEDLKRPSLSDSPERTRQKNGLARDRTISAVLGVNLRIDAEVWKHYF